MIYDAFLNHLIEVRNRACHIFGYKLCSLMFCMRILNKRFYKDNV